jgi:hypothetical protein
MKTENAAVTEAILVAEASLKQAAEAFRAVSKDILDAKASLDRAAEAWQRVELAELACELAAKRGSVARDLARRGAKRAARIVAMLGKIERLPYPPED